MGAPRPPPPVEVAPPPVPGPDAKVAGVPGNRPLLFLHTSSPPATRHKVCSNSGGLGPPGVLGCPKLQGGHHRAGHIGSPLGHPRCTPMPPTGRAGRPGPSPTHAWCGKCGPEAPTVWQSLLPPNTGLFAPGLPSPVWQPRTFTCTQKSAISCPAHPLHCPAEPMGPPSTDSHKPPRHLWAQQSLPRLDPSPHRLLEIQKLYREGVRPRERPRCRDTAQPPTHRTPGTHLPVCHPPGRGVSRGQWDSHPG